MNYASDTTMNINAHKIYIQGSPIVFTGKGTMFLIERFLNKAFKVLFQNLFLAYHV